MSFETILQANNRSSKIKNHRLRWLLTPALSNFESPPSKTWGVTDDDYQNCDFSHLRLYMSYDEHDIRVIRQVLRGDRDAYADIVERYKNPIYNLAVRLTGSLSDAEDLAQDAFIRIYEILDRFDDSKRFFPWMYTVALNVIRNDVKKKRSFVFRMQTGDVSDKWLKDTDTPEKSVSDNQQQKILSRCILKLPITQKEAVVLRYYQNLAFEEIAEIQACSVSAAKMRVYRGVEQLNRLMQSP